MSKVIADITMSLDGYVTGPLADSQHGLGDVDELHTWVAEQDPIDTEILEQIAATGAVVMGGRLLDIVGAQWLDPGHRLRRSGGGDASVLRRHPLGTPSTSGWNGSCRDRRSGTGTSSSRRRTSSG